MNFYNSNTHCPAMGSRSELSSEVCPGESVPSCKPFYRSRGAIPPRLPAVDITTLPKGPRSPQSDTSGSQESSPKPPLSPALKVYHGNELDLSRHPLSCLNERKTVYRKVSNRLLDSSSSDEEDDDNEEVRFNANSRTSSESTPSPRTPNSYKILSGIAHNQATAFKFPPLSPVPTRSSFRDSNECLSSRATNASERQSSDEFSTTMSSFYSRSTSTETNEEISSSTTGNSLSAQSIGARNRRVSPLRKQSAIAEEFLANDLKSFASHDIPNDPSGRYAISTSSRENIIRDNNGTDSGVDCCGQKLVSRTTSNGLNRSNHSSMNSYKTITLAGDSCKEDKPQDDSSDATVENTTGVIFRKVTLKKRLDRSSSSRTVSSEPLKYSSSGQDEPIGGRDLLSNKSHSAGKKKHLIC